jgi:hypothetical protein
MARFEPSCSVYGRECLLKFFRQRVGNDTDLGSFRAPSASCEADDMVGICPSRARPSPPNDVSRTNGRQRMVGSTQSVVIGSLLGGRSDLVSRFRRKPRPRHPRRNRVPGKTQQKLGGESLLAGAGSGGSDW